MSVIAVIGLQWGDEGKGKIVDWLAADASHVARFQGGHNAGHTLVVHGKKTALHLLPSGILHQGVHCYIGTGVVVSPVDLLDEIKTISDGGVQFQNRFFVSAAAALVLPYHVLLDQQRDCGQNIGTTQRGIGPAHEDKIARRAIRLYDLYNGKGRDKLVENLEYYNHLLNLPNKLQADELWQPLQEQAEELRPFIYDNIGEILATAKQANDHILLEGAQGIMLDIEQGTYPFATSAQCLPAAAAGGLSVDLSPTVIGATKAYTTRVGNGPFPTELHNEDGELLARLGEEVGATTGRERRCGWLDIPMLRHALRVSGCSRLALTKLDILSAFSEIPICTHYTLGDKILQSPPADAEALSRCCPQYETIPGWKGESIANIADDAQLPKAARAYIARIEELTKATIDIISTSPERESTIVRRHPFTD